MFVVEFESFVGVVWLLGHCGVSLGVWACRAWCGSCTLPTFAVCSGGSGEGELALAFVGFVCDLVEVVGGFFLLVVVVWGPLL